MQSYYVWKRLGPLNLEIFAHFWRLVDEERAMINTDHLSFNDTRWLKSASIQRENIFIKMHDLTKYPEYIDKIGEFKIGFMYSETNLHLPGCLPGLYRVFNINGEI